jgi:hypothetical protein
LTARDAVGSMLALIVLSGCKAGIDHHAPLIHRPAPDTCSTDRPAFKPDPPTNEGGTCGSNIATCECTSDSQCVGSSGGATLINGRCGASYTFCGFGKPTPCYRCSYDGCFADSDCTATSNGLGLCDCRQTLGHGSDDVSGANPNYCRYGNDCRVDSDCADTGFPYCSLSSPPSSCPSVPAASGWHCHTADDECVDDRDCPGGVCAYNGSAKRWTCAVDLGCVDGGA